MIILCSLILLILAAADAAAVAACGAHRGGSDRTNGTAAAVG
jgi:hypothetical protein